MEIRPNLFHQDHPDVVDVGQRRAGQQQIAGRGEEVVASLLSR
jgi:hypothetical protein